MIANKEGNLVFAKLDAGEDLFGSIETIRKKFSIKSGYVVFGIGALKDFELGYFEKGKGYSRNTYKEPHELIALHGSIAEAEQSVHLHAALANKKKQVVGGHLFGAKADPLVELLIVKLSKTRLTRRPNAKTGLNELFISKK